MKLLNRSTATGLLALGLSLGIGASSALAVQEPPTVPAESSEAPPKLNKGRCISAINRRVRDLKSWTREIQRRKNLTVEQKAALVAQMSAVSNALITVAKPTVQQATTKEALKAACKAIVSEYRVYVVVHPRVFITAAAWGWQARIAELQLKADALEAQGKDTTEVEQLLADAKALVDPIPASIAGIDPATYNADPAGTKAIFKSKRADLGAARAKIREAAMKMRVLASS